MKALRSLILGVACFILGTLAVSHARAQITGFDPAEYTLNHGTSNGDGGNAASISNGVLTITDGGGSESNSAFNNVAQNVGAFTVSFVYQNLTGPMSANGATFTIEADPRGAGALGGRGEGLGWGNNDSNGRSIANSVALEFVVYDNPASLHYFNETGVVTAGSSGAAAATYGASNTGPVYLDSGRPISVNLVYDGVTLFETLADYTNYTGAGTPVSGVPTFTTSYILDIAGALGTDSGYVGFTGGTGGITANQQISGFTFIAVVPEPSTWAMLSLGAAAAWIVVLRRRRARA